MRYEQISNPHRLQGETLRRSFFKRNKLLMTRLVPNASRPQDIERRVANNSFEPE